MEECLLDRESGQVLHERLPQEAVDMLPERLVWLFWSAAIAVEKIVEGNEQCPWKAAIEHTKDKLVS